MSKNTGNGIVIGLVCSLNDPDRLGRVKVKYPYLGDQESEWARLATPMAGKERGLFFRPEVDDEVLIGFELGDPRRPYVIGCLWSDTDKPPPDDAQATQNNWRFIKSRSGHIIKLDDTNGKEKIEIIDKDDTNKVIWDSVSNTIKVISEDGNVEVTASKGTVKLDALTVEIKATNISVEAQAQLKLKGATVDLQGTGPVTVSGTPIRLN